MAGNSEDLGLVRIRFRVRVRVRVRARKLRGPHAGLVGPESRLIRVKLPRITKIQAENTKSRL
eukprot:1370115-Amorphochlora_amoeboformis.AAC.1